MAAVLKAEAGDGRTFKVFNAANGLADNSALAVLCTDNGRRIGDGHRTAACPVYFS